MILKWDGITYTHESGDGKANGMSIFIVYFSNLGQWDGRKVLGKGLKEDVVKYMYKTLELVMQKCKSLGVSKFTIICDNDGLSLWKVAHWDCKFVGFCWNARNA